jgi:hypothetical protein
MSARIPAWCEAVKGQPIRIIPERAKIVRQMFQWAARGLGQYAICDREWIFGVESKVSRFRMVCRPAVCDLWSTC